MNCPCLSLAAVAVTYVFAGPLLGQNKIAGEPPAYGVFGEIVELPKGSNRIKLRVLPTKRVIEFEQQGVQVIGGESTEQPKDWKGFKALVLNARSGAAKGNRPHVVAFSGPFPEKELEPITGYLVKQKKAETAEELVGLVARAVWGQEILKRQGQADTHIVIGRIEADPPLQWAKVITQLQFVEGGFFVSTVNKADQPIGIWQPGYPLLTLMPRGPGPLENLKTTSWVAAKPGELGGVTASYTPQAGEKVAWYLSPRVPANLGRHAKVTPENSNLNFTELRLEVAGAKLEKSGLPPGEYSLLLSLDDNPFGKEVSQITIEAGKTLELGEVTLAAAKHSRFEQIRAEIAKKRQANVRSPPAAPAANSRLERVKAEVAAKIDEARALQDEEQQVSAAFQFNRDQMVDNFKRATGEGKPPAELEDLHQELVQFDAELKSYREKTAKAQDALNRAIAQLKELEKRSP